MNGLASHPLHILVGVGSQEIWSRFYEATGRGESANDPQFHDNPTALQEMEIVATYEQTGRPAIITFPYGRGKVLLLGVHPEIEEEDDRDGTNFARHLDDRGSDWPWMRAALDMKGARWISRISS